MANIVKLKNGTSTPGTGDIVDTEVAIDKTAQALYVNDGGTIKQIGLPTTGGTMTGDISMGDNDISNIKSIAFNDGDATITEVKDDDTMANDSATKICTQQSIKAYVDNLPQWVQFPRMSVRMTTQNYYYMGSKSLGTTVDDGDFQPSDFETTNVALFQNMQASGTCSVSQARIFCTYNGAGTDTVEVHYLQLRGDATLAGEFDTATTLAVQKDVNESMELQDDVWYHKSTTINATMAAGDIIVPVFRNVDAASKYLYYSISYKVYNTLG